MGLGDLRRQGCAGRHHHREGRLSLEILDNVVWSALTTAHAGLALGHGLARHYPRDIAPFSAIAEASPAAYADLAAGLAPGSEVRLFRPSEEATPRGWETSGASPIIQMLADAPPGDEKPRALPILPLDLGDTAEMMALVEIAKPGPFAPRTLLLGDYVGMRESGRLVAMAGARFRCSGYCEISAICTHPDRRGRGLGESLTRHLMRRFFARRERPFLHVYPDNPAFGLYARLGFKERRRLWVVPLRPLASR